MPFDARSISSLRLQDATPALDQRVLPFHDIPAVQLSQEAKDSISYNHQLITWFTSSEVGDALRANPLSGAFPNRQEADLLILGDQLNLDNSSFGVSFFPYNSPFPYNIWTTEYGFTSRLFIIVDVLRIKGTNKLEIRNGGLDEPQTARQEGARVVIFARKIEAQDNVSTLKIKSIGKHNVFTKGGSVFVYVGEFSRNGIPMRIEYVPAYVQNVSPGSKDGVESFGLTSIGYDGTIQTRDGELTVRTIREATDNDVVPAVVLSLWKEGFWKHLRDNCLEAIRTIDRKWLVAEIRRYRQSPHIPVLPEFSDTFGKLTVNMETLANNYILPLWHRRETIVAPSGVSYSVDLFVEGGSLNNYVAPTEVLIHSYEMGGKQKVGFLTSDAATNEITLLFDTEMTIAEWLEGALQERLSSANERLTGIFNEWVVMPVEDAYPRGVKKVTVSVLSETWRWQVVMDGSIAPLVMTQLSSSSGLPLSFDWKFSGHDSVEGRRFTIQLSLGRRRSANLKLEGTSITNTGTRKAAVEYIRIGEDSFQVLDPPLALEQGETKTLPLPDGTDPSVVVIPRAGVLHEASNDLTNAGDFAIADDANAFETVTMENLIPARLQERRQSVRYIEIRIEQLVGASEPFEVTDGGKHRLSPESVQGSTKTVSFLRPQGASARYRVSGHIAYLGGGNQQLTKKVVDTINIDVDESWLPPLPN